MLYDQSSAAMRNDLKLTIYLEKIEFFDLPLKNSESGESVSSQTYWWMENHAYCTHQINKSNDICSGK